MQDVITKLIEKKRVIIPVIKINNQLMVSGIYFSSSNKIMKYMQSWDYQYKIFSPGTVLDWIMIKMAISQHIKFFDFGRGQEKYKYSFGGKNKQLFKLLINLI